MLRDTPTFYSKYTMYTTSFGFKCFLRPTYGAAAILAIKKFRSSSFRQIKTNPSFPNESIEKSPHTKVAGAFSTSKIMNGENSPSCNEKFQPRRHF